MGENNNYFMIWQKTYYLMQTIKTVLKDLPSKLFQDPSILQNLQRRFDWHYIGQIFGQNFVAFSEYMNFMVLDQNMI